MLPLNRSFQNPLLLWLCLLAAIVGLALVGMTLLSLAPNSLGETATDYDIINAFHFDEWEICTRHGQLVYPNGGMAVEAYAKEKLVAWVIWGEANFHVETPDPDHVIELENIQLSTLFLSEAELLAARNKVFMRGTEAPASCAQAAALLKQIQATLPGLQIFGTDRIYPFTPGTAKLILYDEAGQEFVYQEGLWSQLRGPDINHRFWSGGWKSHPSLLQGICAIVLYACFILLLLAATYFATLGWEEETPTAKSLPQIRLLLLIAVAYMLVRGVINRLGLNPLVRATADGLLLASLVYLSGWQLTGKNLVRKLALGLGLGGLATCLGSLSFPTGFSHLPWQELISITAFGLIAAWAQEKLWRGLILTGLQQHYGIGRAVILAAAVQGAYALGVWLLHPQPALGFLHALIIVPLQGLWLNFTYLRSGDLVVPVTIAASLAILPQLLLF
ncbi:MAG: CPBP family intramembrane metalloprotease [Firmicutes bacterium]|nr:CPBP family intramembrane metalloprotease [Bacillota bacterium]